MAGNQRRDGRGRFVATSNVPESGDGKFGTYSEMQAAFQGADPADLAYGTMPRYAPAADDLAQGGQRSPLRPRGAVLVPGEEEARTRYGIQGALGREAARNSAGPMDPAAYLTGAE